MKKILAILMMAFMLPALAESQAGSTQASASLKITIVVPPVNQIQSVTQVPQGLEYRGWTNMSSAYIGGSYHQFTQPGPYVVVVPALVLQQLQTDNVTVANP